jgi:hypothetical protein
MNPSRKEFLLAAHLHKTRLPRSPLFVTVAADTATLASGAVMPTTLTATILTFLGVTPQLGSDG